MSPEMKAYERDLLVEKRNELAKEAVDKYFYIFD